MATRLGCALNQCVRFYMLPLVQDVASEHPWPCCCACRQSGAPSSCSVRASSRMHEVRSHVTGLSLGEQLCKESLGLVCPCCQLEAPTSRSKPAKGAA